MTNARFINADVFDGLARLADEDIKADLVLSSPPFLNLRSYLDADHPDKAKEIGGDPDPATFLSTMLDVVEACAEVLSPTGTLAFEFGDTYSGHDNRGSGSDDGRHDGKTRSVQCGPGWPMAKSMYMIPELFAASLAYGRNLLDPERTTDPWRIRNTIAWVRPNPPVGALGDKFRPAKSLITVAAKASDRWFDLDAVRTPGPAENHRTTLASTGKSDRETLRQENPAGAPPLDWWQISPGGYSGSHYAVWPPELLERPIEAMCPRRVCRTCGAPSRREVEKSAEYAEARAAIGDFKSGRPRDGGLNGTTQAHNGHHIDAADTITTGWSTCGCPGTGGIRLDGYHTGNGWRPGIVLDPFGGTGTTALVATGRGRDAILIDLDERNIDLARERLGMFLTVDQPTEGAA